MIDALNLDGRPRVPLIRQAEGGECGLACLAMVAGYHGLQIDLIGLRRRFQTSLKGATLRQILNVAEALGFSGRPLRTDIDGLKHLSMPLILHWNFNHFVVLTQVKRHLGQTKYHVHDPAAGLRVFGEEEFTKQFTGVSLELIRSEKFQPKDSRTKFRIRQLWSRMEGFWPQFWKVFFLSALLQGLSIISPLFMQISIDSVLRSFDGGLLILLALGFGGVAIISTVSLWVRSLIVVNFGSSLSYQVTVNLFRHLLRLPLSWFQHRHVGDIISRFGSTKPISDLMGQGLISVVIDGGMALILMGLLFIFSPILAIISVSAVVLTSILRFGFFSVLKQANVSTIIANAREGSFFIEAVRGIATIKAFGDEANRQRIWQQRKADAVNMEIKSGRIGAGFSAVQELIMALERVLFVYFSIRLAMASALTLGMIFALQSYRQQFLTSAGNLIQQIINFRLLDMHLARIADIALSPTEIDSPVTAIGCVQSDRYSPARIELRNVWYRYAPGEPEVLRGVNLVIEAGEMIALVGTSGGGKTTLMKIVMGLLTPTSGDVVINGQSLSYYGVTRWRREIGSVAQDDVLFAGSIADNISLFDLDPNDTLIESSARSARIHEDISRMPMRYHTSIGDMGSVLSGGQKQRVVLARALYRQPSALFLDEATAHLDSTTENDVGEAIRVLACTRLVIAHRPQTIKRSHRVYHLQDGRLIQSDNHVGTERGMGCRELD